MNERFRRTPASRLDRSPHKPRRSSKGRSIFSILTGGGPRRSASAEHRTRFVEPLEDRRLLSVTTAYVANAADFTDTSAPADQGNPQAGDIVTWNGGGQFTTPVAGLTFGTDAFININTAAANVSSGGTVDVAPGTYDEHDIVINQSLTLNGPNTGINPNTGTRGAEAIIDAQSQNGAVQINANNVTVDGFQIQGGQNGSEAGVAMYNTTSGVHVLDNIITKNQIGIYADSDGPSLIQDNLITDNNLSGAAGGAGIYSDSTNGLTIDGNAFTNQTINSAIIFAASASNVHQNLTVTNNAIDNNAPGNSAIYVVAVEGGEFADNDIITHDTGTALHFAGDDTNISVHNNNFDTVTNGVAVTDDGYGLGNNSTITVNYNSFTNASTAALSIGAGGYIGTLDASRNWWGDASGPTIAGNVGGLGQAIVDPSGQVTFAPWLIYGTDADLTAPGFQLPTTVPVASLGDVSPAVNDFTLLQNAIGAAATGQTIDLSGNFDWTATNAAAAYAASTNTAQTADIRGLALPDGVTNLTITSSAMNAKITGVGDSTDAAYNAFLFSAVDGSSPTDVGNGNLTVSNLNIDNFESGLFLGWNNGGTFNGAVVKNNTITLAGDSDNNQADGFQSIAVYFWNGHNQTMTGNTIDFMGNGTRTAGNGAFSYGFQDGTTGGTGYDGLSIDHNIFRLLPSAIGGTETVTGVWENGHNDDNASHISISDNQFLGIQGQRQLDIGLQLSSQTSNMSIDGNTFTDVKYVYWVGTHNGDVPGDQFTFASNTLARVGDANGIFLQNAIDNTPGDVITINWGANNSIDGFTGIRGLNELSTQATGASRPSGAATDLDAVVAFGPVPVDYVNANWGAQGRFTNPLALPDGTPGPIAFGFNTFATVQDGVNAVDPAGTVNVLPGTYAENVTIGKDLTLTGITASGTTASPPTAIIQPAAGDGITISAPASSVTIADLEITGAANGINASGLTTLNLSDLTLTGNTTAGGTISNVTTVNDTPLSGGTGATDTITGSSIQRGSDDVVNYSGVTNLNVTGSDGSDTFNVTPAASTTISLDGGLPAPPATPGDTLNVVLPGTMGASLNDTFDPVSGHFGAWTFTNAMPINFLDIETLGNNTDLSITKTDNSTSPGSAVPGTSLTYTIVVTNNGTNEVTGASVDDTLPGDFTNASYTATATGGATGFTPSGSGDIHDMVTMPAGSTITYTVTGTITSSAVGTVANTAAVTAPATVLDTNLANNIATDTDTLTPRANISLALTDDKGGEITASPTGSVISSSTGSVVAGTAMTYTIVVTNSGPSDATGETVTSTFSGDFRNFSYTATSTGGATGFTTHGSGNVNDRVNMPSGSTVTYVVTGTVYSGTTPNELMSSSAAIGPGGPTMSVLDYDIVTSEADLSITKTDDKGGDSATNSTGSVVAGTAMTYTIVVSNTGPSDVTGATITDPFPRGFVPGGLTGPAPTFTGGASITSQSLLPNGGFQDIVNLPANSSITYVVPATVASSATGTLSNTINVSMPAGVTNTGSTTATDNDTVTTKADVTVTKKDDKGGDSTTGATGSVTAGTTLTYTIVVSNTGPSDVTGATIADLLPAGFSGVSYTKDMYSGTLVVTTHGSGNINDTVDLPAGTMITYVVTGTVAPSASGTLSNTVNVTIPAGVTNTGNLSATDTDTVTAPPPPAFGYLAGVPGDGTTQTFVQNLYRELLGRDPDANGQAFWLAQLQQNSTAAGRQGVIEAFLNSDEYKAHYITTLYEVFLGRVPEQSGSAFWTGKMGQPGTAGLHSGSADESYILSQIVGSDEFYAKVGGTPQAFANALYQDLLGRAGSSGDVAALAAIVSALPHNRDTIVRLFLASPEAEHKLLDSFYPAPGGTASNPLAAPGTLAGAGLYDLAEVTGAGWENLYLEGAPSTASPGGGNDAFFAELAGGTGWDDVQVDILTSSQFYNNPNRPVVS